MEYAELIAKALKGRSVNSMAKEWGVPQPTLDNYVKGKSMPDFRTVLRLANEAGVEPGEALVTMARAEEAYKARKFKLQMGFAKTKSLVAMALIATGVNLFLTPTQANAAPYPMTQKQLQITHSLYYVK